MHTPIRMRTCGTLALCVVFLQLTPPSIAQELPDVETLAGSIESFKTSPRGPFERIAWFCADGSVLANLRRG